MQQRTAAKNKQISLLNDRIAGDVSEETKLRIKINNLKEEQARHEFQIREQEEYKEKLLRSL